MRMGQITNATIKMIRDHIARGEHPPLTAHEIDQLATAWERGQPAASAEPVESVVLDALSGLVKALRERHYGRMPDEVQAAYDKAWTIVFSSPVAAPVAQEPVAYRVMRKSLDGEWKSDGRDWCDGRPSAELVADIAKRSDGWRIEYAYAPASVAAQAQPSGNPGELPVVNQQMTTAASDVLADTQRAIIEAAEQRGYARAMAECAQDRQDAERYRWAQQFMRLDDVGDDQYSLGLVIDSERLEGCVSDEAARLDYERNQQRWANVKSPDDEPADIPVVTLNDAIDAARAKGE